MTPPAHARQNREVPLEPVMDHHDKILIVDFGSQVTQLIARRVREEKVYCEIVPYQKAAEAFLAMKPKAVILSGGPASVTDKGSPRAPQKIFDALLLAFAGIAALKLIGFFSIFAHTLGR